MDDRGTGKITTDTEGDVSGEEKSEQSFRLSSVDLPQPR